MSDYVFELVQIVRNPTHIPGALSHHLSCDEDSGAENLILLMGGEIRNKILPLYLTRCNLYTLGYCSVVRTWT